MTPPIIAAEELTKTFVRRERLTRVRRRRVEVHAVEAVSFQIEPGELVGYLGPNGAGKSTTIKMLTGILQPTSGHLSVAGLVPLIDRKALARRIGVVFGQRSNLWWDLPLGESFDLLRHIYSVESSRHRTNLAWYSSLLELGPLLSGAGPPVVPRTADAGRARRRAAPRPRGVVSRRADHRPRRGLEARRARRAGPPAGGARRHGRTDHARPLGRRGALRPDPDHRSWAGDLRRVSRRPEATVRRRPRTRRRPARRRGAATRSGSRLCSHRRAAPVVAVLPRRAHRSRSAGPSQRRDAVRDLTLEEPAFEDIVRRIYLGEV